MPETRERRSDRRSDTAGPGRAGEATRSLGTKGRKRAGVILDATLSVLTRDGHAALSLRSVATHAGVRLGHLQYYYGSKRELLQAATARELERRASAIESLLEVAATKPENRLDSMLAAMLGTQQERETIQLFGELRALALRDETIAELMRRYATRYWRAMVESVLAANPVIRRPSAERRAALLVSLLEGLMLFRSADRPTELPLLGLDRELHELSGWLVSE